MRRERRKVGKLIISLMFVLMLSGCGDEGGNAPIGRKATPGLESGAASSSAKVEQEKLAAPQGIKWEYKYDDKGTLALSWNAVNGANKYEVMDSGGGRRGSTEKTSCVVTGIMEGEKGTLKIRSVAESANHADYSDWSEINYEIEVHLGTPGNFMYDVDGSRYIIFWDAVNGADGYEIETEMDGEMVITDLKNSDVALTGFTGQGQVRIRAKKTIGDKTFCSDWVPVNYSIPTINLSEYGMESAVYLDYDHLLQWADLKGYEKDVKKEGEITIVDLHEKDPINGGLINKAARALGATLGGFLGGYVGDAAETVTGDFSTIDSTVNTIMENEGIKDYVGGVNESAKSSGKRSALMYGLQAILEDTDMHYVYYFTDKDCGAVWAEIQFLKAGRENYTKERYGGFTKEDDGTYHLKAKIDDGIDRVYYVTATEIEMDTSTRLYYIVQKKPRYKNR